MSKPRPPFFVELTRKSEKRTRKDRFSGTTYEIWVWQWRFRKVSPNGKKLSASEGYYNRSDCLKTLEIVTPGYHLSIDGSRLLSEHLGDADAAYAIEVREIP